MRSSIALAVLLAVGAPLAGAQDFPSKPIRWLIPFPPGGASDAFARIMGQKMSETWGQQVIIDNRPGAGGNLAAELIVKAPADGYTIIMVGMSHGVNVSIYDRINYNPERDFSGITHVANVETFLIAHPSLPVKTVRDVIALAKSRPGELLYGSGGSGAPGHLAMELFKLKTGTTIVHVPYKGALSMGGLTKGDHTIQFENIPTAGAYMKAGKVKVIAAGGARRSVLMPDIPTVAESGVPGYDMVQWFGSLARAGTPKPVITKLNDEMVRILKLPDVREKMSALGSEPIGNTPEQYDAFIRQEVAKWAAVAKAGNIRAE